MSPSTMKNITTKQFQILTDIDLVWRLMTEVYNHEESNGPAAPFFEYAVTSPWMDKDYLRLDRFWMDGEMPVGFVFYEQPVTAIHFVLRPGYEELANEMIEYAETAFPKFEEPLELVLISGQKALIEAAKQKGYVLTEEEPDRIFDLREGRLDFPLPEGYHFVEPETSDPLKVARCLWDGFNKWELGEFKDWDRPEKNEGRSPHELYQNVLGATISPAPHATYQYTTIIADEEENYVCFSGMWWVPENHLAYMEPLCTVPEHQHKGLAAAALSHHDAVLRPLGAEVMTGGGNTFYEKIGYRGVHMIGYYRKA
ncbi:MAG: GNAT family N-acetyltransferase [Lachnospiraceae bacterium]|nr:GNAT family N-acetyltransferase [Lachnospiraceae bacterium]